MCMYWLDSVTDWWLWDVNVFRAFSGRLRTKQPLSTPSGISSSQVDSRARSRTKMVSQSQRKCLHRHTIKETLKHVHEHVHTSDHSSTCVYVSLFSTPINFWRTLSVLPGNIWLHFADDQLPNEVGRLSAILYLICQWRGIVLCPPDNIHPSQHSDYTVNWIHLMRSTYLESLP